jgi:hypothetical protein
LTKREYKYNRYRERKYLFYLNHGINTTQRQVVAYLSQKEDIPTFPRFYLNDHFWYRLRLKKRRISMLMVGRRVLAFVAIQLFFSFSAKSPLFGKGSPIHEPGELLCGILAEVNNLPLIPIILSSGNA